MKKILILIMALCFAVPVFASKAGWFTGSHAYPKQVTLSSTTSTTLFTNDGEIESVQYENRTGYDVCLTTYALNVSTWVASVTSKRILQSGKWPPFKMDNTNYRFVISTGNVPVSSEFYIDINK